MLKFDPLFEPASVAGNWRIKHREHIEYTAWPESLESGTEYRAQSRSKRLACIGPYSKGSGRKC